MKLQISLDDELVSRIDGYADGNYMSRSGLISLACVEFLNKNEMVSAITRMSIAIQKIASTGVVDEETQKQLEDFERLSRLLTGG